MHLFSRRRLLRPLALGGVFYTLPGAFAEALQATPRQTEGPFFPDRLPLDTDNDLLRLNDAATPALGEVTYLGGRILDREGQPLRDAVVEIWQCDANGAYLHSRSGNAAKRDGHFQGFGRFLTGRRGEYLFRTIKPVPYPGRTPHIHVKVSRGGTELLTTQCYIQGHPQNERDGVLRGIRDPAARASLQIAFDPLPDAQAGELAATFDIVVGLTPKS
jgi:protocatechuate 3,4-dioxygenase beta subunit